MGPVDAGVDTGQAACPARSLQHSMTDGSTACTARCGEETCHDVVVGQCRPSLAAGGRQLSGDELAPL